jgi:hypothetical protein
MLDRTTTAAITARHGLAGDRAEVVGIAARMTDDAAALDRTAELMAELDDETTAHLLVIYERAWAEAQRERGR